MADYSDKYCPICTCSLDDDGDHWTPCEYEASRAKPEYAPLTEKQMLMRRIGYKKDSLTNLKKTVKFLKKTINGYEQRLTEIS